MNYSTNDIQTAVEKLVSGSISRPSDTLGVRRPDLTFTFLQEAAAGVFTLYPLSPFYAVQLGSKRMLEAIRAEAVVVQALQQMTASVGRRVLPVETVENLFNAGSALQQLEVAVAKQAPRDITKLPAFQRFALNVQEFLTREGGKVKERGVVVPTPQEARAAIPGLVRQLVDSHLALIESVQYFSKAMGDYALVNLPSLVARGVVSKAREVLSGHAEALEALPPEERLSSLRSVVLDLLAAKSVVQKFGSTGGLTIFVPLEGTGVPYADATHPATPASKMSNLPGPYALYDGANQLVLGLDGSVVEESITLNNSFMGRLSGIRAEQVSAGGVGFIIGDGVSPALPDYPPPNNNQLRFVVSDLMGAPVTVNVLLASSALAGVDAVPRTALNICSDIADALLGAGLSARWKAEPYFLPTNFYGTLNIENAGVSEADFVVPAQAGGNLSFVKVGDLLLIEVGPNTGYWTVTSLNSPTSITAEIDAGVPVNESLRLVEIGDPKRAVRIRAIDPSTQIMLEDTLSYAYLTDVEKEGANTLGFPLFGQAFCRPTTAQQVADDINVKLAGKLSASSLVDGVHMTFRTEPGLSTTLVSSKLRTLANLTFTGGTPNVIAGVVPNGGLVAAGVVVGDLVVLRGGVPASTSWTVTSVSDTTFQATSFQSAINGTGVSIEFGVDPFAQRWDTIDISEGLLQGRYYVSGKGTSDLDLVLFAAVNASQDPSTHLALTASGTYGWEHVVLTSQSTITSSAIAVNGLSSAASQFFTLPTLPAYGTTPWFLLPQASVAVDTGDQLEVHATQYNEPSGKYAITTVNGKVLGISPEMPSQETWSFNDQPPPFARIRNGTNLNYAEYKALLDTWLQQPVNTPVFFRDLNRYLNPLLQNATPTADQVGTALANLEMLLDYLIIHDDSELYPEESLEGTIAVYKVDPVGAVNTLIKSFVEKGADRAIDLLLQGRFSSFFAMDVHDTSYAGVMQKELRVMVREDIPVRSVKRQDSNQSRLRSSAESPDMEFTFSDADDVGVPDIPADYDDTPR